MFNINILDFMYNFGFKGDTLYRFIPSGGIDLIIHLMRGYNITGHRPQREILDEENIINHDVYQRYLRMADC